MNSATILTLAVVVLVVLVLGFWFASRRRRSAELRRHFGAEYDRAVDDYGDAGRAERALTQRAERVEQLHIRPLSPDRSAHYASEWRAVQARFVDDPAAAIAEADRLIGEAMQARGYPMSDFEQRAADISVEHPDVVEHYRAAHTIAVRTAGDEGQTEDMRQAMLHYRFLFDDLIDSRQPATQEAHR